MLDAFVRPRALVTPYLAQSWPGIGHVAVGMHRQGFDLQLTQYDERGWRATFYTLADQRDGHRMGADAVARDAAGGVGGAKEDRRG